MDFIADLAFFYLLVIALIVVVGAITFKRKGIALDYFKSGEGKGAIASAGLALVAIAVLALLIFLIPNNANAAPYSGGTWFNDAGVYMGIDQTRKISPQCTPNSVDNKGTSNLGLWGNVWQSADKTIRVNTRYTHHSCFLGKDRNGYDGLGVNVEWKIWNRK